MAQDAFRPLEDTERQTLGTVKAVEEATESIEHHVAVLETLATSVGPLTTSVDRLTDTMQELVKILTPLAEAERGVERAEHVLGFHRHQQTGTPDSD